ncbi:GNAT family N-acetyltransferase [Iodobacter fluviatilis]|uniref:Acetyltransferase (GNAT) family n=1 Tax=Iodobacter fluviatilis TaxID=537 RepID=A0A377SYI4_9NEIS|nr:GNAT family N-acetyltransferase [Iodobacter fluviatilis]TCU87886.1 RimJ/RimL family protein N-acetyltransferase [Iodobacter fluviatilis]STR45386.1 Acetyltransferase (GNAT) family [Iodobacter fluviatilis]
MPHITTARLCLSTISINDAAFYLQLLNEPSWHQFIGDRGIRTLEEAQTAIINGPVDMQNRLGFSLYIVKLSDSETPIGLCGLLKRDYLEDADLGYAFLPQYWGQGFAFEAATGVVKYAKEILNMPRLLATTDLNNQTSIQLLNKLNFKLIKTLSLHKELNLFSLDL